MLKSSLLDRYNVRQHVRTLRRNLTTEQQKQAANLLTKHAINFSPIANAQHIALFLSIDGEINTRPLIVSLWKQKKHVYLPVLHPFSPGNLLFSLYTPEMLLSPNRLCIPEPTLDIRKMATLDQLDVMLVPLVAFDHQGRRLGMGGGFYDRTLQNWQKHSCLPMGIAHDCQRVEVLPVAAWDISLPFILTPSKMWHW